MQQICKPSCHAAIERVFRELTSGSGVIYRSKVAHPQEREFRWKVGEVVRMDSDFHALEKELKTLIVRAGSRAGNDRANNPSVTRDYLRGWRVEDPVKRLGAVQRVLIQEALAARAAPQPESPPADSEPARADPADPEPPSPPRPAPPGPAPPRPAPPGPAPPAAGRKRERREERRRCSELWAENARRRRREEAEPAAPEARAQQPTVYVARVSTSDCPPTAAHWPAIRKAPELLFKEQTGFWFKLGATRRGEVAVRMAELDRAHGASHKPLLELHFDTDAEMFRFETHIRNTFEAFLDDEMGLSREHFWLAYEGEADAEAAQRRVFRAAFAAYETARRPADPSESGSAVSTADCSQSA